MVAYSILKDQTLGQDDNGGRTHTKKVIIDRQERRRLEPETPVPLKMLCCIMAVPCILAGLRGLFACDHYIPIQEGPAFQDFIEEAWPNCRTNKYTQWVSGSIGAFAFLRGVAHFQVATATYVSDIQALLTQTVLCDSLMVFIMTRLGHDSQEVPFFYHVMFYIFLAYEMYVWIVTGACRDTFFPRKTTENVSDF